MVSLLSLLKVEVAFLVGTSQSWVGRSDTFSKAGTAFKSRHGFFNGFLVGFFNGFFKIGFRDFTQIASSHGCDSPRTATS